uniref:Uncharacterized protein n=1 Tax=viral metagenome TaxID=1070528 RepID=A0A6H1ZMB6_9ZZZZ
MLNKNVGDLPVPIRSYAFLSKKPGRIGFILFRPIYGRREGFFETDEEKLAIFCRKLVHSTGGFVKEMKSEIQEIPWIDLRKMAKDMNMPDWNKAKRVEIEEYVAKNKS